LTTDLKIGYSKNNYRCLIHLDRLSITFRHWSGSTLQDIRNPDYIPVEQVFKNISLIHDKAPGPGAFYHSFRVYYKGLLVGKLHTAAKVLKHELQFDFSKEIFYSFYPEYWYEVYSALKVELGLIYNNIMYVEISIDTNKDLVTQFAYYFSNCENNKLRVGDRFFMRKSISVSVMSNGSSFVIDGSDNGIAIYNKSEHAEDYIITFFSNNGFTNTEVYRIESRLTWNYIRMLRNKKLFDINIETLLDPRKLAMLFRISTFNKITFKDRTVKTGCKNKKPVYLETSVMDEILIETAEIGKLNPELQNHHYKDNKMVDENIIRQIYYRYLETDNKKYFRNFRSYVGIASIDERKLVNLVIKFNERYRGNRTDSIKQRMEFAIKRCSKKSTFQLNEILYSLAFKMKWNIKGMF
jgi:hypothetical protein